MRLDAFAVDADLVGRRIRVSWQFTPEAAAEHNLRPPVVLHRKTLDFEFPSVPADLREFVVYDDAAFPPPGLSVSELPERVNRSQTSVESVEVASAWTLSQGVRVEVLRRTIRTLRDLSGIVQQRSVEILDSGPDGAGLTPGVTWYYRLQTDLPRPGPRVETLTRLATATATHNHGYGRTLFDSLPNAVRRHDTVRAPSVPGAESIPEASQNNGQLRRFLDVFGVALDSMRSGADHLRHINDIDNTDHRFLPYLAQTVGWDLSFQQSVPVQRHEIKYAAALYRITGTIPGAMIWAKRLTGWDARVKEFARNVFFTYNTGHPRLEGDRASRTVNTADPALLSNRGRFEDALHYSYDTGVTPQDWYALNVVGLFVTPPSTETFEDVRRKAARLRNNLHRFLPFNIRGVVIVVTPEQAAAATGTIDLLNIGNDS
jgi:phage tail-like protein